MLTTLVVLSMECRYASASQTVRAISDRRSQNSQPPILDHEELWQPAWGIQTGEGDDCTAGHP